MIGGPYRVRTEAEKEFARSNITLSRHSAVKGWNNALTAVESGVKVLGDPIEIADVLELLARLKKDQPVIE